MSDDTLSYGDGQEIPVILKKDGRSVEGILRWCSDEPMLEIVSGTKALFVYAWKKEGWTLHRAGEQA